MSYGGRTVTYELTDDPNIVIMTETFDVTHPNCSFVWLGRGGWPPVKLPSDMVSLMHRVSVPKYIAERESSRQ